jgi:hypothetical protein
MKKSCPGTRLWAGDIEWRDHPHPAHGGAVGTAETFYLIAGTLADELALWSL